jgi:hypothetical protein
LEPFEIRIKRKSSLWLKNKSCIILLEIWSAMVSVSFHPILLNYVNWDSNYVTNIFRPFFH